MALEIEEKFRVAASVERVWKFMLDPREVVTCLPGAELVEVVDARTFTGNMKVKVGPVSVAYKGKLVMTSVDDAAHKVTMVGEGTEKGGAGSAKMSMESHVVAVEGGAEVIVKSSVDLVGRLVQFGRGMVKGVAQQLFKQFAAAARAKLEAAEAASVSDSASESASVSVSESASVSESDSASVSVSVSESDSASVSVSVPAPPVPAPPVKPVSLLPLIFKVIFRGIANFFRRLVGRPPRDD